MGAITQPCYDKACSKERCQLVLENVKAGVEEEQINKVVSMWQTRCLDKMEGNSVEENLMV